MATQLTLFFPSKPNKYPPIFPIPNPKLYHHHRYHYNYKTQIPKIPFSSSSFRNGSNTPQPETECPVPLEQQPINEYQNLSTSFPFSWASGDIAQYSSRLFITGTSFALFIGLPVAWLGTVGPDSEPLKRVLCAFSSGVFVVTLAVLRMYLGWAYVGNRLLSATVECIYINALFSMLSNFTWLVAEKVEESKQLEYLIFFPSQNLNYNF